jgi:Tol biopolymer transport system component/C-terminal processing protease CtpA/Prc
MKKLLFSAGLLLLGFSVFAQVNPQWLRYPAISPDGKTILFSYKGDIYSVPTAGGTATPFTLSESYEYNPVWSHDGKQIAFASDRYGNFDVFVMPAGGGEAKRLTFFSGGEVPSCFSADNKSVLFTASRQDLVTNAQFPVSVMNELYSVPANGGKVSQVFTNSAADVSISPDGSKLLYNDIKGYEDKWRKHHTSAITRDVWEYDFASKKYQKLTTYEGEDRNPVFAPNGNDYYYLCEKSGSLNVYQSSLSDPSNSKALTSLSKHPVRFLSCADNNTLCFGFNGEIYTMKPGSQSQKVNINIAADGREGIDKIIPVNSDFSEATLSPNGKEYAYVYRGEIFVSSIEGGVTKRITNTPWQERSVNFSPDGRSLVFAAEKDKNWNIYTVSISRKEEPYFYASTVLKEETVVATPAEEFQPMFSPDGKEVAYLENRVTLKVINLASKKTRTILPADKNYSYSDGDQYYQWSPDGKWFLVQFGYSDRMFFPEVGLVSADGKGEVKNLTLSGYNDVSPKWSMDGKMMVWFSDREGALQQGGGSVNGNVYGMFFSKTAFDRFSLSKEDFTLLKDQEDKQKKDADKDKAKEKDKKKKKDGKEAEADSTKKDLTIDWDNLTERKLRLTQQTADIADFVMSKDGEKLFYLVSYDKGYDLWQVETRTKESKQLTRLGAKRAGMELSSDGKFLFVLADGKATKIDTESGKTDNLSAGNEMVQKGADERAYIFDHAWRQFKEKFYLEGLHGTDWDFYYTEYKRFLPYINNNYDFAEMLSEMLGEVNASHTGCRYRSGNPNGDKTASLGLFYDYNYTGEGLRVAEVIEGGPIDKAASKIKTGCIIEKIDGQVINDSIDFYSLLNRKEDKLTLLSVYNPQTKTRWDETCKPISIGSESELLYKRWVKARRDEVEKLSDGKIGYIHVESMDDASMRTVFDEALGRNLNKEAIIIDTRFNGGGNIHEQLSDFLSGKKYIDIIPHGQYIGSEPLYKWVKPSVVVVNEGNYSDAHLFPVAYRLKGIGKTVGTPVPGTGTFVWWERQIDPSLVFGIPMGGWKMPDGKFCENTQFEPDIKVANDPDILATGRDQQLEAAVKELLKK